MQRLARSASLASALSVVALVVGCGAPETDEDLGSSDNHITAGRTLTANQVAALVRQAGFPEEVVSKMVCTAYYESRFDVRAVNNDSHDYGLFQVNQIHFRDGGSCPSNAEGMFDATKNAKCALSIFNADRRISGHSGMNPWVAYRTHPECSSPARAGSPWAFDNSGSSGDIPPASGGVSTVTTPSTPGTTTAPGGSSAPGGTCNREGAFYCGNPASNLKGDPNTLYHCVNHRMIVSQQCAGGCTVSAQGVDDLCAGGGSSGFPSDLGDTFSGTGTGTDTGQLGFNKCVQPDGVCNEFTDFCCDDDLGVQRSCLPDPQTPGTSRCSLF